MVDLTALGVELTLKEWLFLTQVQVLYDHCHNSTTEKGRFRFCMRIDIRGFTDNVVLNCLYFVLSDELFTPLHSEYS